MDIALAEARSAGERGEVPVGAVVVAPNGEIISRASNRTRERKDPSAHAEMLAIRAACELVGQERLVNHDLFVTLEPCAMCASLISAARIRRLYYGASDQKSGGVEQGDGPREGDQADRVPGHSHRSAAAARTGRLRGGAA